MKIVVAPPELLGDPESNAMMQAFYSRSKRSIEDRLAETTLDTQKIKDKLKTYFVGYGHDSIGQVGFTTFFIEGVSILADKAIQDDMLYNGQESSTRYIDFSNEPLYVPQDALQYREVMEAWVAFYYYLVTQIQEKLVARHLPNTAPADVTAMEKACKVKAFDIASAFLPCGVTTNLSWTTSLANVNKRLLRLAGHQLQEVRDIAAVLNEKIKLHYPSIYIPLEARKNEIAAIARESRFSYQVPLEREPQVMYLGLSSTGVPHPKREGHAPLPHHIHNSYFMQYRSVLDYRSFRDVQRHRTLSPSSPIINPWRGINSWYIKALDNLGIEFRSKLTDLMGRVQALPGSVFDVQYACPMGLDVEFTQSGYLGDWLYYAELRTGETVHPTVRLLAKEQWDTLDNELPMSLRQYLNARVKVPRNLMDISYKRAAQDIVDRG